MRADRASAQCARGPNPLCPRQPLSEGKERPATGAHTGHLAGGPHPQSRRQSHLQRPSPVRATDHHRNGGPGGHYRLNRTARLRRTMASRAGRPCSQPRRRQEPPPQLSLARRHALRNLRSDLLRLAGSAWRGLVSLQRATGRSRPDRGPLPQPGGAYRPHRAAGLVGRGGIPARPGRRHRRPRGRAGRGVGKRGDRGRVDRAGPNARGSRPAAPPCLKPEHSRPAVRRRARYRARTHRRRAQGDRVAPGRSRADG